MGGQRTDACDAAAERSGARGGGFGAAACCRRELARTAPARPPPRTPCARNLDRLQRGARRLATRSAACPCSSVTVRVSPYTLKVTPRTYTKQRAVLPCVLSRGPDLWIVSCCAYAPAHAVARFVYVLGVAFRATQPVNSCHGRRCSTLLPCPPPSHSLSG